MVNLLGNRGWREYAILGSLLVDPSLIPGVASQLGPNDFFRHEAFKPGEPIAFKVTPADNKAGLLRQVVFDAIANRGAHSPAALEVCLTSGNNQTGNPVNAALVAAVLPKLRREAVHPQFGELVAELVSDAAKWRAFFAEPDCECDCSDDCPADCACECHGGGVADPSEPAPIDCSQNKSMATLAATPRVMPYLIPGVLAAGQPCLAFGREKSGKTNLLGVDLAFSLATGTKYLGYFDVPRKRRVLLLSGESGEATLIDSFLRVCRSRETDPASVEGFELTTWLPTFGNPASIAELGKRVDDAGADVVIVDPAGPCMSAGAAATLSIAYAELRAFAEVCNQHGATPILLHHCGKGADISRLGLRAAAGAGFAEWARQWVILDRIGQFRPATGEHRLRLTAGGSAGHAGRWLVDWREGNQSDPGGRVWDLSVRPAESKRKGDGDGKLEVTIKAVAEAMKSFSDYESGRTIKAAAGMNNSRFTPAIAQMVADGVVVEREITKGGQRCAGYRLAAKSDTAA